MERPDRHARALSPRELAKIDEAIEHMKAAIAGYQAVATDAAVDVGWATRPAITHLTVALGALAEVKATGRLSNDARLTLQSSAAFHEAFSRRFAPMLRALI